MKKQRFTEEQIIAVLKEQEAGAKVADLCRKHAPSAESQPAQLGPNVFLFQLIHNRQRAISFK